MVVIPVTYSADDEILLYPLPGTSYREVVHVTGSATAWQALRIESGGVVLARVRANESGDFAAAVSLVEGVHSVRAVADIDSRRPLASATYKVRQIGVLSARIPDAASGKPDAVRNSRIVAKAATAPVLTAPPASTGTNPITLSGTAQASATVSFYVNGRFTRKITAAANGTFSSWVPLEDGLNSIYAVADDGTGASPISNTVQTTYTNSLPRTYSATTISVPTVWTAGSAPTYTLNGAMTIASGATLWIQPGVTVSIGGNYKVTATGSLVARGAESSRVVFRPVQALCTETSPRRGDWIGIETGAASGWVDMEYADVYCADDGVYFNLGAGVISHTRLLNGGTGIRTLGSTSVVNSPLIVGSNELRGNTYGAYLRANSRPVLSGDNLITGNTYGVYVYGNANAAQNPVPEVNGNNLYSNSTANFTATNFGNPATTLVDAQGNWWGTADPSAILATIQDRNSGGSTRPYVDYSGFLGSMGGGSAFTGQTLVGPITADTTLAAGEYLMLSDISVDASRTLTLSPGTYLRSAAGRTLLINGSLQANGTSTQRVRFGSSSPYPAAGDWLGIEVVAGGTATISRARVEHATNGIFFNGGQGTVANSLIRFNTNGIYVGAGSNPTISSGNEISNNSYGLYVRKNTSAANPQPVVTGNSVFANASYNYYTYSFVTPKPTLNATGNWWGTSNPTQIAATIYTAASSSTTVDTTGYLSAEPFPPAIHLTAFAMTTQEAKPIVSSQPAAGTFTLNRSGTVTFRVYRESDGALVREWNQAMTAGSNGFTWDGRGELAQLLPVGMYRVVVTATDGLDPFDYDAPLPTGVSAPDCGSTCSVASTFNPYLNEAIKVQVRYLVPTLGNLQVTPSLGTPFYPVNDVYYPPGYHWLYWDGRGTDGALLTVPATVWAGDGKLIRPNGVYVFTPRVDITGTGAAPNIEVRSDPYLVASSYEQASKIVYRLSLDAVVRVSVLPPGVVDPASPQAIVLVNNVSQSAKDGQGAPVDHVAEWRGFDAVDPNAMLADAEGAYTFAIEATLPATGQKTLYRGVLNVRQ